MTYIYRQNLTRQPLNSAMAQSTPMSACGLLLTGSADTKFSSGVASSSVLSSGVPAHVTHSCWTGRTGKDYLLALCTKDGMFVKDDQVILLAKRSGRDGFAETVLWVGHMRDLIDDPAARSGFRSAMKQMDHAYCMDAPQTEDGLHILVWDLEKAVLNLSVQAA